VGKAYKNRANSTSGFGAAGVKKKGCTPEIFLKKNIREQKKAPRYRRASYYFISLWQKLNQFFDSGSFALTATQVVQASSSHTASAHQLDLVEVGRKKGEDTLYTNTVGNFAYGEGLTIGAGILALDNRTLKLLDTLFVSFANLHVYIYGITGLERRKVGPGLLVLLLYKFYKLAHIAKIFCLRKRNRKYKVFFLFLLLVQ
jgi:hypothetical protein